MVKQVPITGGRFALVDDADDTMVAGKRWHLGGYGKYAHHSVTEGGRRYELRMHRFILDAPPGSVVDHINGDTLDNRRGNLRVVTQSENMQNLRQPARTNTTGVLGVTYHVRAKKYVAQIQRNRQLVFYRYFDTIEEAAAAVKEARRQLLPYSQETMERSA